MSGILSLFIPSPRLRQVDRVAVAAPPERAWELVRSTDLYDSSLVHALFDARLAPEWISRRLHGEHPTLPKTARLDDIVGTGSGFDRLADIPGLAFVAGAVGKFWQKTIPFVHVDARSFATFSEPGFGKVVWSLEVHPRSDGGSWIEVDLRVDTTDDGSWEKFESYWALIGRFSHAIRKTLLRRMVKKLGAAKDDALRVLPGDELIDEARAAHTLAVTIEAPAHKVWPWLVQMGCGRAGWYSIDELDNGGVRSADHIVDELQHVAVGDILPATPKGPDGFAVLRVDRDHALVLGSPNLLAKVDGSFANDGAKWTLGGGAPYEATWSFFLEPIGDMATNLVVRVRASFAPSVKMEVAKPVILSVHSIMEHAQLRHLKHRAESIRS